MNLNPALAALILVMSIGFAPDDLRAQISDLDRSRMNTAAYYNYAETGDVTIKVHVWGSVRFPGLYAIPVGTRFLDLMSLAGGPQVPERSRRQTRTIDVRLERGSGSGRSLVFDTSMENSIIVDDRNPVLQDGDVLAVESVVKQGVSWRDIFPVISSAFTLILIIDRIGTN